MVVTQLENTFNEDYIESFFKYSFELQNKFKEEFQINSQYLFVQSENLNSDELKIDGFLKVSNE